MKRATINIGLSNNTLTKENILKYFATRPRTEIKRWRVVKGTYKGNEEETLYISIITEDSLQPFLFWLELLCIATNQECIAYKFEDVKILMDLTKGVIMNPTMHLEEIKFDEKYFIEA